VHFKSDAFFQAGATNIPPRRDDRKNQLEEPIRLMKKSVKKTDGGSVKKLGLFDDPANAGEEFEQF